MKKRILSAFIAVSLAVCGFSGCSDSETKQSSDSAEELQTTEIITEEEETETTEEKTVETTQETETKTEAATAEEIKKTGLNPFEFEDFSLSLGDNFIIDDSEEYSGADLCIVSKDYPVMAAFIESASYAVSAYGHAESFAEDLKDDPEASDITFKKCSGYALDTAVVKYKTTENEDFALVDMYYICEQASQMSVIVMYTEGFESEAQQVADKIINSLEYTSDFYYPAETQTFENEFFSVVYEPQWIHHRNAATDDNYEFKLKYGHTDSMDNYLSSYSISVMTDNTHDNAEEYAESHFKLLTESQSEFQHNLKKSEDEIFGIPAHKVSRSIETDGLINYNYNSYYFDYNNTVYFVSTAVPINDDGTVAAAIRKLIDNTALK